MAILALLARAGDRGVLREKILTLLWPDADAERGSRTLAQALYALRKDLVAEDAITGSRELRFDPALVTSDVTEFVAAISRGDDARAAELYQGPFLDGFHVSGADEFTRWVEQERAALAQDYGRAVESLARRALANGNAPAAVGLWRRLAALDPLNARITIGLMEALAASGDRAGAINHARVYELLVEQQLELPPDRNVTAFAARLRAQPDEAPRSTLPIASAVEVADIAGSLIAPSDDAEVLAPAPMTSTGVESVSFARRFGRSSWIIAGAAVSIAGAWLFARGHWTSPNERTAVVAVGRIASYGMDSSAQAMTGPVADLLATSLARSPALRVVSAARMLELMHYRGAPGDTGLAGFVDAARRAGATEIIDGTLYSRPGGALRLDLRRVDLASGSIRNVHSIEGDDFFALVDSGTARLLAAHGTEAPSGSIAGLTTRSVAAYSLYVEGVKALTDGDVTTAERLLASALREDSTFAMAAYYYGRTNSSLVPLVTRLNRALRLSARATDRERLLIRAGWAWQMIAPELGALADSLAKRYPQETEGHLYAGVAHIEHGEYLAALAPLRRVVDMDSLSFTRGANAIGCNACIAMLQMVAAYQLADSLDAAEREARRWTRLQPDNAAPWIALWDVLERAGSFTDAAKVAKHIATFGDNPIAALIRASSHALRTGDLTTSERLAREALESGTVLLRREALWQLVLSLRYQGRATEAVDAARRYRALAEPLDSAARGVVSSAAVPLALTLSEAGRHREAAALFDSMSYFRTPNEPPSVAARERAWRLTHEARALAQAGDTTRAAALADTIAAVGLASGGVREHRLDRYVRGLVLLARRDMAGAEAAFRSAVYSLPGGYTRVNCELASVLLQRGRPREAVAVLQPALRGKLDASNYHVTHTEIHALLAQAWDAAGRPDSAAVHHAWVARAWERGDPPFAERAAAARRHVAAAQLSQR